MALTKVEKIKGCSVLISAIPATKFSCTREQIQLDGEEMDSEGFFNQECLQSFRSKKSTE